MRTSDPAIFAVGDVAEYEGTVLGLWPTGVEQAEVAAENAVGGSRRYGGTVPVTMLKVLGIDVMSCGRIEVRDDEDELIVREDETARTYHEVDRPRQLFGGRDTSRPWPCRYRDQYRSQGPARCVAGPGPAPRRRAECIDFVENSDLGGDSAGSGMSAFGT